jgi:hypothetical protein
MGGDGITDDEFAAIAGPGAEGTLMTFSPDPRTNPANKEIVAVFRKKGFEPQAYTLYSYAALQIIKQAAEQAKTLDTKKVAAVISAGKPFKTVLGDISTRRATSRTKAISSTARRRTATCSTPGRRGRTARSAISRIDPRSHNTLRSFPRKRESSLSGSPLSRGRAETKGPSQRTGLSI